MRRLNPESVPPLDSDFLPAAAWNAAFRRDCDQARGEARTIRLSLERPDGSCSLWGDRLLPERDDETRARNLRYLERRLKALLWSRGAARVGAQGLPAPLLAALQERYAPQGERAFDHDFMGSKIYLKDFEIYELPGSAEIAPRETSLRLGGHRDGCRVGFDLGGSDRKCAALREGELVFSEEIPWAPYFEQDPDYHYQGILDSIRRAGDKLPRIDAIGGSAAGVYVDNEVRAASLFRGVAPEVFEQRVRGLFKRIGEELGIPLVVVNDGEVTALAGAMARERGAVLGIALGTSEAAGYVDPSGCLTNWLNELAFVPVDYAPEAPADEWSGDRGCGVQYFSQQAVGRLLPASGLEVDPELALPEKLVAVQEAMQQGAEGAEGIFRSIGRYLGWSLAHYAEYYDFECLLLLGRVTSGAGGECIRQEAAALLRREFPALGEKITLEMPSETEKRHGQAAAAATLAPLAAPAKEDHA